MYQQKLIYPREPVAVEEYGEWNTPAIDMAKYYNYWYQPEQYNISFSDLVILQKIAGEVTPEDAVIISRKASLTGYYSGRKSNWYLLGVSNQEQWAYLKKNHATHILITDSNPDLINLIRANPENFRPLAMIHSELSEMGLLEITKFPDR